MGGGEMPLPPCTLQLQASSQRLVSFSRGLFTFNTVGHYEDRKGDLCSQGLQGNKLRAKEGGTDQVEPRA